MPDSVRDAFERLPDIYNKEMAAGLNCVFQFDVTGEGGGHWYVQFDTGTIAVHKGEAERPNLRITVSAQDWLDLLDHTLDYTGAYTAGKLHVEGELPLHKKVAILFIHTHHKPADRNLDGVRQATDSATWVLTAHNGETGNDIVETHETRLDAEASAHILTHKGYDVNVQPPKGVEVPPLEFSSIPADAS